MSEATPIMPPAEELSVSIPLLKFRELSAKAAIDDPQWDGTDDAHPAWWRGNDAGVAATLAIVQNALHGLKHSGMYGEPMESLVKEIEALVAARRN